MKTRRVLIPFALGLGLAGAVLWLLCGGTAPATAAPVLSDALSLSKGEVEGPACRPLQAPGDVITVCLSGGCDYTSVQAAVDAASDGDVIKVAAGIYTDVHVRPRNDVTTTSVVTQVVYVSETITIRGGYTTTNNFADPPDSAANPTTLDAGGTGRVVYVTGDITVTLENLRITGGNATSLGGIPPGSAYDDDAGGGVYVISATVTLSDNRIYSNAMGYYGGNGGGVFLYHSANAILNGNTIYNNMANGVMGRGGGVCLVQSITATLTGNHIYDNETGYSGGGVCLRESDNATLIGNHIYNNTASGSISDGGGVFLFGDNTTLSGNRIYNNTSRGGNGGGISLYGDNVTLSGNEIYSNTASGVWAPGGGVSQSGGNATLSDNHIYNNTASGYGGGVCLWGNATLNGNEIYSNTASGFDSRGGGVYLESSITATLTGNRIYNNTASGWASGRGGGVSLWSTNATLTGNYIYNNTTSDYGGGISLNSGNDTLDNNIIADNQASANGSGVYVRGGTVHLRHNTLARNTGGDGSGIHVALTSTVAFTNTILVSHSVGITVTAGNTAMLNGVLWYSNTTANTGGGGTITVTNAITGNPAFTPDGYHLTAGSAAIDQGVDAGVTTDIDGEPRPIYTGYDIGADEFNPLEVSKEAAPDPVQAGAQLTYTLRVTNTGNVTLHATVTDTLPAQVTPTGTLTWTRGTIAPGGVWTEQFSVTVEMGYAGPLTNVVQVTTEEGATGIYTETSTALFKPLNQAPYTPSHPIPADLATDVPITQTLRWQGGDPDGDPVTYTVAFGASDPPPFATTTTLTTYTPSLLADTTYYWAITARDGISTSVGPTWRFTTVGLKYVYLPLVLRQYQ